MSLIEGIGDEVIALAAFLVLATTIVAAWFSTNVQERPGPQVTVRTRVTITTNQQSSSEGAPAPGASQSASTETLGRNEGISEERNEGISEESTNVQSASERPNLESQRTNDTEQSIEDISNTGVVENKEGSAAASSLEEKVQSADFADNDKTKEDTNSNLEQEISAQGAHSNVEELGIDSNRNSEKQRTESENAEKQRTESENVLRNRNTGQIYPTLPTYGSSEQTSGGISEEASHVEDITRTDEETSPTQEGGICIRVKFSNDEERLVNTYPEETLGQFRRQNFVDELEAGKLVRFIANGQILSDDNQTLSSLNLTNNSVLHCHVTQGEPIRQTQHNAQDGDLDLGHFMVPLFGCILGFVWYLRWQYRYMFNATSTLSLIGVTVLFFLAVLAAWRG